MQAFDFSPDESKNINSSSGSKKVNKMLLQPNNDDPLIKRELFAISLRKKKTKEIVNEKRRKI